MNYSIRVMVFITDPREGQERQLGLPPFSLEAESVDEARKRVAEAVASVTTNVQQAEQIAPARRRSIPIPREQPLNPNELGHEAPHVHQEPPRSSLAHADTEQPEQPEQEPFDPRQDWER